MAELLAFLIGCAAVFLLWMAFDVRSSGKPDPLDINEGQR